LARIGSRNIIYVESEEP